MIDRTYTEALEATEGPRTVLLGPLPCKQCGAWVEWAGVAWLALASDEVHECTPYLQGDAGYRYTTPRSGFAQAHPILRTYAPELSLGRHVLVFAALIALLIGLAWWAQQVSAPVGG